MSVAVTEVPVLYFERHPDCESRKHGLLHIRYRDEGLLLRITPDNTFDGGACADLELAIIGYFVVLLFVIFVLHAFLFGCFGQYQRVVFMCLYWCLPV